MPRGPSSTARVLVRRMTAAFGGGVSECCCVGTQAADADPRRRGAINDVGRVVDGCILLKKGCESYALAFRDVLYILSSSWLTGSCEEEGLDSGELGGGRRRENTQMQRVDLGLESRLLRRLHFL
jgi:hypothetical protein